MTETAISTAMLLDELNELRDEAGMKPLASWKSSRVKLEEAIDKLDAKVNAPNGQPSPPLGESATDSKSKTVKKPKKPADKKKKAPSKDDGLMGVSDVAKELGINPKVARAKLRRNGMKSTDGRWIRVKKDSREYKEIVKLLKKDVHKRIKVSDEEKDA